MNRVQLRARGPEGTSRLEMFSKLHWGSEGVCQRFSRGAAFSVIQKGIVSGAGGLPGVRLFPFGLDSHSGLCLWGSPCIDFGFTVDARE